VVPSRLDTPRSLVIGTLNHSFDPPYRVEWRYASEASCFLSPGWFIAAQDRIVSYVLQGSDLSSRKIILLDYTFSNPVYTVSTGFNQDDIDDPRNLIIVCGQNYGSTAFMGESFRGNYFLREAFYSKHFSGPYVARLINSNVNATIGARAIPTIGGLINVLPAGSNVSDNLASAAVNPALGFAANDAWYNAGMNDPGSFFDGLSLLNGGRPPVSTGSW